jgi:hypothetical protein
MHCCDSVIAGRRIRHEVLSYHPSYPNAIAATSSGHVLIAEDDAIHIHDEGGRRVGGFTKEQLQVEEWGIHGISYSREDDTLTVLAGDDIGPIRSVQTFRVSAYPPASCSLPHNATNKTHCF